METEKETLRTVKRQLLAFRGSKRFMLPLEYARAVSKSLHIPEHIILAALLELQEEGRISLKNGRIPVILKRLDYACGYNSSEIAEPGWGLFRKLIAYYIECVKSESAASFSIWNDRFGERFSFLKGRGKWYPQDDLTVWSAFLPSGTSEYFELLNEHPKELCLGYPLMARRVKNETTGGESVVLTPVFCWRLDVRYDAEGVVVSSDSTVTRPEVNLLWLSKAFSKNSQKRQFLNEIGLFDDGTVLDAGDPDLSDSDEPQNPIACGRWSVCDFAQVLSRFFREKLCEPLVPDMVSSAALSQDAAAGYYNRASIFIPEESKYTKRLLGELREIAKADDKTLDKTALRFFFCEGTPVKAADAPLSIVPDLMNFTVSQRKAVSSMLNAPVTVMQGPPGTGKSQVVAGVSLSERLHNRPVLISAANHKAIDAVIDRIAKLPYPQEMPFVARCNTKRQGEAVTSFKSAVNVLCRNSSQTVSREEEAEHAESLQRLARRLQERTRLEKESETIRILKTRLDGLTDARRMQLEAEPFVENLASAGSASLQERLALIEELLSSGRPYLFELLRRPFALSALLKIERSLPGKTDIAQKFLEPIGRRRLDLLKNVLIRTLEYAQAGAEVASIEKELQASNHTIEEIGDLIRGLTNEIVEELRKLIPLDSRIRTGRGISREELFGLRNAREYLSGGKGTGILGDVEFVRDLSPLLWRQPVWAVTSLSVGRVVPLTPGLFDLVLVDEATQSNIAQAIPLLFRARRAAVIGDPMQLQYISRLTPERDERLRKQAGLDDRRYLRFSYCQNSLYDFAANAQGAKRMGLNETFRSCDEIAAYSSVHFYGGRLGVETDPRRLRVPRGRKAGIQWIDAVSSVEAMTGGSCFSETEAKLVAEEVKALLVNAGYEGTIGVVTPFASQARLIDMLVRERSGISAERLEASQFLSATAHSFQGDERDVIIMSLCADDSMPAGCRRFILNEPNIFNVAVSRARALLVIVGNKLWASSSGATHISGLTKDWRRAYESKATEWAPYESPAEQKLGEALKNAGLDVVPQHRVGCRRLDLALFSGSARLDIEVDSDTYHRGSDGYRKMQDIWRDEELIRRGWKPLRIWTFEINRDLDGCVERVKKVWDKLKNDAERNQA